MGDGQTDSGSYGVNAAAMPFSSYQPAIEYPQSAMNQTGYKSFEDHRISPSTAYDLGGNIARAHDVHSAPFDQLPRRPGDENFVSDIYTYPAIPRQSRGQASNDLAEPSLVGEQQAVMEMTTTRAATIRKGAGSRKKSRKNIVAEEELGEQKARGRPRLDAHDESASDVSD